MSADNIEWRDIGELDNKYAVSSDGQVRNNKAGRILKQMLIRGYRVITICFAGGVRKKIKVHRLVANAFVSSQSDKPHVNHINGKKEDNRAINLEWCNATENNRHARKNGLMISPKGEKAPDSKLTNSDVDKIIKIYKAGGISQKALAAKFGVTQMVVSNIMTKKRGYHGE